MFETVIFAIDVFTVRSVPLIVVLVGERTMLLPVIVVENAPVVELPTMTTTLPPAFSNIYTADAWFETSGLSFEVEYTGSNGLFTSSIIL